MGLRKKIAVSGKYKGTECEDGAVYYESVWWTRRRDGCIHALSLPALLNAVYAMPYKECQATLTDIGTEELAHLEIVAAIVHQLTRNLTAEELEAQGFGPYYIDHTTGIWPQAAGGVPFNACEFQSKGDPVTDLFEDLAAEQKARSTYDNILRVVTDPDVCEPIRFLRKREIVHFQRFGEALRGLQEKLDSRNFYAFNPSFDPQPAAVGNSR